MWFREDGIHSLFILAVILYLRCLLALVWHPGNTDILLMHGTKTSQWLDWFLYSITLWENVVSYRKGFRECGKHEQIQSLGKKHQSSKFFFHYILLRHLACLLKQRRSKDNLFYFLLSLLQYTTEDLLSLIQASEEEILHQLQVIDACKIEGICLQRILLPVGK